MAAKEYLIDINLNQQRLLNAALQIVPTFPASPVLGQVLWNSGANSGLGGAFVYAGTAGWIDLSNIYTHPTFSGTGQPSSPLTGASVISRITLNNGHVTGVETRNITASDIGAASSAHTHAFGEITGLPTNTILGNNTAGSGPAKALTVGEMLTLLGIAYGTLAQLNTGTDTAQRTWSASDLNSWVNVKLGTYLTVVDLALGAATGTTQEITNNAGTGVILPSVTTTLAGLMSAADKIKLEGIAPGANNYVHYTGGPGVHPFSTELTAGLAVLSQMTVTSEGHVVAIKSRNLTAADLATVMIVSGSNITSETQTWSAKTLNDKLQDAVTQVTTGALVYQPVAYAPSTTQGNVIAPTPITSTTIKSGMTWVVTESGYFGADAVEPGDMIIAKVDNAGTTFTNYQLVNKNIPAIVAASELVQGIIQIATIQEALAGVNNLKAITPATLNAVLNMTVGGYYAVFGDGATTSFNINHGLNTDHVIVQTRRVSTKKEVITDWAAISATTVTVNVNIPPGSGELEIIIKK